MEEVYHRFNPWWQANYRFDDAWIERPIYLDQIIGQLPQKSIQILVGSRRVGKTTLLKQVVRHLIVDQKVAPQNIFYFSADHPQLQDTSFLKHLDQMRRIFQHPRSTNLWLFLDEVQERPHWQSELKSIYDLEQVKILCTGSSATLIERHGGKLTGRQISHTIFPLRFAEFLNFRGLANIPPSEAYRFVAEAENYMRLGGYPEHVLHPNEMYLSSLIEDILARDIVRIFSPRKPLILKNLLGLLAAALSNRISYNKLAAVLGISVDTVKDYVGYLQSAYLVQALSKASSSVNDRIYSQKKIYFTDLGIHSLMSPTDFGPRAENLIFNHLQQDQVELGYFAESEKEVDFIYSLKNARIPIESKYISVINFSEKRWSGLKLFLKKHPKIATAYIITKDLAQTFDFEKTQIIAIPLWRFLLDPKLD